MMMWWAWWTTTSSPGKVSLLLRIRRSWPDKARPSPAVSLLVAVGRERVCDGLVRDTVPPSVGGSWDSSADAESDDWVEMGVACGSVEVGG